MNNSQGIGDTLGIAVPGDLYERLGLKIPRWLLWVLTVVLGTILSSLLVSSLALWTPLWSNLDKTNDEELGIAGKDQVKLPVDLWNKLGQYQLSRPMNILVMGLEPVKGAADGSKESLVGRAIPYFWLGSILWTNLSAYFPFPGIQ